MITSRPPIDIAIVNFPVNIRDNIIVSHVPTILRDIALRRDLRLLSLVGWAEIQIRFSQENINDCTIE